MKLAEVVAAEKLVQEKECERIKDKCMQEIYSCQEEVYSNVSASSLKKTNDALLLPSVAVPDTSYPTDSQSVNSAIPESITGVDRVTVMRALKLERQKTLSAYREAQCYQSR
jgi:hypothetical protein